MRFWGADSDRDYADEVHRYDEPRTVLSEPEPAQYPCYACGVMHGVPVCPRLLPAKRPAQKGTAA